MHQLTANFAGFYDRCDTEKQKGRLEHSIVRLAATGFIVHLLLIDLARTIPFLGAGPLAGLDRNFLHAVYVIRNAGFVISTVLLRISPSTPKPYDLAIGLVAMIYGLCVLSVFSYFTRVNSRAGSDAMQTH